MFGSNKDTFQKQQACFGDLTAPEFLRRIRGIHAGRRAFVIANGPSLAVSDLDCLTHEITFAANKIYLAYGKTEFRPTYWCCSDALVAEQNLPEISRLEQYKIGAFSVERSMGGLPRCIIVKRSPDVSGNTGALAGVDLLHGVHPGVSVVVFMLKLAHWMGITTVYLIGLDFDFQVPAGSATGEKVLGNTVIVSHGEVNHFHPDYRKPGEKWTYPLMDQQRDDFRLMKWRYESGGRRILNASRKSKLNVFERCNFDDLTFPPPLGQETGWCGVSTLASQGEGESTMSDGIKRPEANPIATRATQPSAQGGAAGALIEAGRDYLVYGAGSYGLRVRDSIVRLGARVVAFSDRDPAKQAAGVNGIPVLAPSSLPERRCSAHRILVATMFVDSAVETLVGLGLKSGEDFVVLHEGERLRAAARPLQRRRAVLFGASLLGQQAALNLGREYEIVAFVDNNKAKWGGMWAGRPIHSPEFLKSLSGEQVIISSSFHAEIARQLQELGIRDFKIFGAGATLSQPGSSIGCIPTAALTSRRPDILDRIGMTRTTFGETLALIHGLGHRPQTVVDVGVAFGTPELYRAFPEANLLLIEPLEEFRPYMEKISAERPGVRFVVAAAGSEDGSVDITVTPDKSTSSLLPLGSLPRRRVPLARVETLCRDWNAKPPYVIKVDVQGHELAVMDGCAGLLADTLAVVLEVNLLPHSTEIPELHDVIVYMKKRGFVAYDIMGGHNRPLDFARCQVDIVFVQEQGPLRIDRRWSTPDQNAEFREAKQSRAVFSEVMLGNRAP